MTKMGATGGSPVRMKKEVGLLEGVAIIMGIIIGSGKVIPFLVYIFCCIHATIEECIMKRYLTPDCGCGCRYFHLSQGCAGRCSLRGTHHGRLDIHRTSLHDWCRLLC